MNLRVYASRNALDTAYWCGACKQTRLTAVYSDHPMHQHGAVDRPDRVGDDSIRAVTLLDVSAPEQR